MNGAAIILATWITLAVLWLISPGMAFTLAVFGSAALCAFFWYEGRPRS